MERVPTIRDVARVAGVSVATVSRVLNTPQSVRESTRHRVEAVIAEMNYRPASAARQLSTGRTYTISVVVPFLTRPSFVERLRAVEAALSHSAYDLVVSNIESAARWSLFLDGLTRERRHDGCLVMTLRPADEEAEQIVAAGVPMVLVDNAHPQLASIDVDDVAGGYLAATHLLGKGHRCFAILGDNDSQLPFSASDERLRGFVRCLDEAGVELAEDHRYWIPHSRREARQVAAHLLAQSPSQRPTAVFATSDTTALGILDGLRQEGLRAPDDLAVMGFDDLEIAELYDLTTIRQPLFQSGAKGVEYLLTALEYGHYPEPRHLRLPLALVERGTT